MLNFSYRGRTKIASNGILAGELCLHQGELKVRGCCECVISQDVYDTRVGKMIEWMDHLEMAIGKVSNATWSETSQITLTGCDIQ